MSKVPFSFNWNNLFIILTWIGSFSSKQRTERGSFRNTGSLFCCSSTQRKRSVYPEPRSVKEKTFKFYCQDEQFYLWGGLHIRWLLHGAGPHLCARGPDRVSGSLRNCVAHRNTWKHLHLDHSHQVVLHCFVDFNLWSLCWTFKTFRNSRPLIVKLRVLSHVLVNS